jgi:hypothetical protein
MYAQVAKTVVVEHFTNTRCGVCADQNPSFFQNLALNPGVKHIAYHPTSPYSNCLFAQHNVAENNGRTNYYNLFGSTPRLAINGAPISNNPNPYINPNLYDNVSSQTSSFIVRTRQTKEEDTIRIRIVLETIAVHSFSEARLYAGVAEDTVFYNAPNGENRHYNVFRKSFFGPSGIVINPAQNIGDSVVFESKLERNMVWDFNRIFAFATLQDASNRALIQADFAKPGDNTILTSIKAKPDKDPEIEIFPNPAEDYFTIRTSKKSKIQVRVIDLNGKILQELETSGGIEISTSILKPGIYTIQTTIDGVVTSRKIVKK